MQNFSGLLRRVVESLNGSGLRYMFTGAVASSYYGRPRTTLDIDVVVAVGEKDLERLAKALKRAGLVVDERSLKATWHSDYRIVTLLDRRSPHTVDIIFTDQKLMRIRGRVSGLPTYYETAQSLILAKLRMLKVTVNPLRAVNDREDIKAIIESTKVRVKSLRKKAEAQNTIRILDDLLQEYRA